MLKLIQGLPPDVLANSHREVDARGLPHNVDPEGGNDARQRADQDALRHRKECTGFELEALWDDGRFGMTHWRDFSRIAVVTEHAWLRSVISMFAPFMHGEVRLFDLSGLPAAKEWIVASSPGGA